MTGWEVTFNIAAAGTTIALLLYVQYLLKTYGRYRSNDLALVAQFRDTAPYHCLDELFASRK